jgi:diguanylate cyclase (GGDEF)-like protein
MVRGLIQWFGSVGNDAGLARAQVARLQKQVPLLYGLLLINSLGLTTAYWKIAPALLTLSVPLLLFGATAIRMIFWMRAKPVTAPREMRRLLQNVIFLSGPLGIAYVAWSLALSRYGDSLAQAHVGLYISTTVIGCIFCLVHLPQAAIVVAACVMPACLLSFATRDHGVFAPMALNVVLVLAVLLRVLFNSFNIFRQECEARSELDRLYLENRQMADSDALTGLHNRRRFYSDLSEAAHPARIGAMAVGLIDLDRFKPVNDTFGHHVGDQLLVEIAQRLSTAAGDAAALYRIGGDEFAMIMRQDAVSAMRLAEYMCSAIAAPVQVGDRQVSVGASIGVAPFADAQLSSAELAEHADHALYHAKREMTGRAVLFSPEIERRVCRDHLIEVELHSPVFEDELRVALQPIVSMQTGNIVGGELLARWNSVRLGNVEPQRFVEIAERSVLIHKITRHVVRRALELLERLPTTYSLSVNVSASDLQRSDTVDGIIALVRTSPIEASRLCIEVTETAVMRDLEAAIEALGRFRAIGIKIALDDFGTGYSSLSNLHRLPLDKVKIDRSFAMDLGNPYSVSIVSAVVGLCSSLSLTCIVEGVETAAQAEKLQSIGCDLMQGYLFGRPEAPEPVIAALAAARKPASPRVWAATSRAN